MHSSAATDGSPDRRHYNLRRSSARLLRARPLRTQIARTDLYRLDDLRVPTRLGKLRCGQAVGVLRRYLGPPAHQLDDELEMPAAGCAVERCPLLGVPHSDQESAIHELGAARQVAGARTVVQRL